ncbi:STAS domain-containing protein [Chitinolyticbacter meiyuanensis]|uniref:STAS domain-containing protein n=1 Tax=Chitinolyticbacter meiyuanensis TaxID=682798 RepID=UPI0011E5D953|nr:STAS domain-containing protein [Chitinolyticbacter meiyuanensis]
MSIASHIKANGQFCITVKGEFTYSDDAEFRRAAYLASDTPGHHPITLDLGEVSFLDTAALGQLMMLRERVKPRPVQLVACSNTAHAVLDIMHLLPLFRGNPETASAS